MRVLIAGIDGYLGWPLAQCLAVRGHEVAGVDNFFRRYWVEEIGSWSAIPIPPMRKRLQVFRKRFGTEVRFWEGDLRQYDFVERICREFRPDAIVHLGECPSAPYSMIDIDHASFVQVNNITTTLNLLFSMRDVCPQAHLVKLGTMGEYGTPNVSIPEGFFEIEYRGRRDRLPFPRQAGSWYHWSKVHDSNNVMFAAKIWNLSATDIMQGVVFGTRVEEMGTDEHLLTRLDFDHVFGTIINRFCCQAIIGQPLTLYGDGHQKRGFLSLADSMQCLTLALENPARPGEYRVFNQFDRVHELSELAQIVQQIAKEHGFEAEIRKIENPRLELEDHYYCPDRRHLSDLGYRPTNGIEAELRTMICGLMKHRDRIEAKKSALLPNISWGVQQQNRKAAINAVMASPD